MNAQTGNSGSCLTSWLTHNLELSVQEALSLVLQGSMGGHWNGEIPVSFFVAQVHLHTWEGKRDENMLTNTHETKH